MARNLVARRNIWLASALLLGGCKLFDAIGLSKPVVDVNPATVPCNYQGFDRPCLYPAIRDTILTVGDTETVTPNIIMAPLKFYTRPFALLTDTGRQFISYDSNVAQVDGLKIVALAPGTDSLVMTGNYIQYPLYWKVTLHVIPKPPAH